MPDRPVETEARFQQRVVEAAALYGWRHCHTRKATVRSGQIATPTSVPGWPDLVLWSARHGSVMFVELKTDRGSLTPQQVEVLESLSQAGAHVAIWRPRDWSLITAFLRDPHGAVSAEDHEAIVADSNAERAADAATYH